MLENGIATEYLPEGVPVTAEARGVEFLTLFPELQAGDDNLLGFVFPKMTFKQAESIFKPEALQELLTASLIQSILEM